MVKVKTTQNIDDTLVNAMSGDISYEELSKVEGISTIALKVKKEGSTSFFKKSLRCPLENVKPSFISYKNVKLLKKFSNDTFLCVKSCTKLTFNSTLLRYSYRNAVCSSFSFILLIRNVTIRFMEKNKIIFHYPHTL